MEAMPIEVRMLGEFSLCSGSACVNSSMNRTKKVWLLLAYLICNRSRAISPNEMVDLLWSGEEGSSNPLNALKTMFHRARATLEPLGDNAGHRLILRRGTTYAWNLETPTQLDVDDFERLCQEGSLAGERDEKIRLWMEALALYRGDFLSRLSSELWVVPLTAHYHNLYVNTVLDLLPLLSEQERWEECEELCRTAVERDPYIEDFYRHWMQALLRLGRQQEAVSAYEEMSELFLAQFGVMPSEEMLSLYREALRQVNEHTMPSGMILEQLREPPDEGGALICEYDVFKAIYHSLARSILRSGDVAHLGLLSILPQGNSKLPRRSLDRVVENLRELLRTSLRRGDVVARCSVSQFILLLPQANFENSRMVCDRLIRTFTRQYPHSPARLHISIHPLEPNERPHLS